MTLKSDLLAIKSRAKKERISHASGLSEAERETMREALRRHIANGTATPKMLQLSRLHGVTV